MALLDWRMILFHMLGLLHLYSTQLQQDLLLILIIKKISIKQIITLIV